METEALAHDVPSAICHMKSKKLTAIGSLGLDEVVQELLVVQLHIVRMLPPCSACTLSIGDGWREKEYPFGTICRSVCRAAEKVLCISRNRPV